MVELRDALDRTQQYGALGDALRNTLIKRILHPGATTTQIIDIYISTIKVGATHNISVDSKCKLF